ncbi:MAG: PfkB family carbohydrate kinase [Pseudomonadota bacterium]
MAEASPRAVVLGSAHMDLIASAPRLPGAGESIAGESFGAVPGGKAANQAVQLAAMGVSVELVTRLGNDGFGREIGAALGRRGVGLDHVARDFDHATGASTVFAASGDYASIIVPGAAAHLSAVDVSRAAPVIAGAGALLLQLETPAEVSAEAARIAARAGTQVVLNAAPAPAGPGAVPAALWQAVDVLAVNGAEAAALLGRPVAAENAPTAVVELGEGLGIATVLLTLGAEGIIARHGGEVVHQPAFPATVADAVGAGDAFLATFVAAGLAGHPFAAALRRGAAAGALAVGLAGALPSLPERDEVEAFLARL